MNSRRSFLIAAAGLAAGLAAVQPAFAEAPIENEAKGFLTDLGNRAITQLADKSASKEERTNRFRALLMEAVDFPLISQTVLGRHWRSATEPERLHFAVVLRETLIYRFLPLFDNYKGETFSVVSTRTSSRDPSVVAATTNVMAPNGETARVEWYMKQHAQGLRIYDFSAEGVRLTLSLQDEYNAVLRQTGGDIAGLTKQLQSKLPPDAQLQQ